MTAAPDPAAAASLGRRLRFQAGECARLGSLLYADLLARAAEDVEAGGPTWEVLRGHENDPGGTALALRLMGAVQRRVLEGELPRLKACYMDPGTDPDETWRAFSAALLDDARELRGLVERPVQTNEIGRCAALLAGFLTVAAETELPLSLLELGSSAGLNLRWDRYRYEADGFRWGPPDSPVKIGFGLTGSRPPAADVVVFERWGCDAAPLDPLSEEGMLTLASYIWPDQPGRGARTVEAFEVAGRLPVLLDRAPAAGWLADRLAEERIGRATVVFHSIVMQYLTWQEREAVETSVRRAGESASDFAPLARLRMEPAGEFAEVRLTTWPGGEDRLLARAGYHGDPVELL